MKNTLFLFLFLSISYVHSQTITTVVGNGLGGYSGDGGSGINAQLNFPSDVKFDPTGNMYIVDQGNNVIRKVSTGGIITTIAGNGIAGFSGDGGLLLQLH